MKVSGSTVMRASRQEVWNALNDPAVLVQTIPGCQRLESAGPDSYTMSVSAGVGSIKGVYDGQVRLTDQDEPTSFVLKAEGAGAPGTIGASVQVNLADADDGGTSLTYDADAVVGGMIGGVGQRMLTGVSKKMAAQFFGNVEAVLSGTAPAAAAAPATTAAPAAPGAADPSALAALGLPPGPATAAPGASSAAGAGPGQVFTPPAAAGKQGMVPESFGAGVLVGAGIALAGVVVGGWLTGRRQR